MAAKLKPPDKRSPTCFGMHHRGFLRFFVVVNMMQYVICITIVIYDVTICMLALPDLDVSSLFQQVLLYLRVVAWSWFALHCVASSFMDIPLFRTATSPSTHFIRIYALFQCISLPLYIILHYTLLLHGGSVLPWPPVLANLLLPGHVLYRLYTSYIIYRYSRDIDFDIKMKSGYRNLNDDEIALFEQGMSLADEETKQKYYDSCYEMAQFQAYDKKEFEINRKDLDFSESTTLGCGEYGCVYRVLWNAGGDEKVAVAVKTVDPEMSDVNQFKALLTEAKVMMCMGRHENVVGLIGICTDEIRERKLYIICELCDFGNLRAHLRSERNTFVNLFTRQAVKNDVEPSVTVNIEEGTMTSANLVRWAAEIAAGMEFLAERKIIHGDLAARNVLLTSSRSAKITDFGLSRRLYNYSVYKKRHNVPLPWRWLALESLVDMSFSTNSDVWSYGITCCEIFELGARPWPEFKLFTSEFIEALKDGRVPEKGEYCTDGIYDVMCLCWKKEPHERPSFTFIKQYFSQLLEAIIASESGTR